MLVRLEDCSRYVNPDGEELRNTAYLRRRLRDRDLVKAKPPKPSKEA